MRTPAPDLSNQPTVLVDAEPLRASLPRILTYWREWLRETGDVEPRTGDRGERELALIAALIDAAVAHRGAFDLYHLDLAAREYGALPRTKPIDPQELSEELGLLRHAIWRCVQECYPEDRARLVFVARLDDAISKAVQSTLRGGYHVQPEARGE